MIDARRPILLSALLILIAVGSLTAQGEGQKRPSRFNRDKTDTYPLGGIEVLVHSKGAHLTIHKVTPKGPGDLGKLEVGDKIIAISGKKLVGSPDEKVARIAAVIEKIEAKKPRGKKKNLVLLQVIGADGKKVKKAIPVRPFGKHSSSCPSECEKCETILTEALNYLKEEQSDDGHFAAQVANNNHSVATVSMAGLAWLGHPEAWNRYEKNILNAADYVIATAGKDRMAEMQGMSTQGKGANWNQSNWAYSYAGIFLGELIKHKEEAAFKNGLRKMVTKLAENQELSGGWAHGPGGPNALNYLELEIMSNLALGAMGLAERAGIKIDEAKKIRGIEWVKKCTTGGGVAYSPKPGQAGNGDPGRTAGAYWAFRQCGRHKGITADMFKFYSRDIPELYEGHACATMHVLNGALASSLAGKKSFKKFWKIWRPFFMASRHHNGTFDYRPNKESRQMGSNSDRAWGAAFVTAHYALCMQLGQGRYKALDTLK